MLARLRWTRFWWALAVALTALGSATTATAADVCISIDEARDTFSPQERNAALMLVSRQFEIEGAHVVPGTCDRAYVLTHVQLGPTISITLVGPEGRRDATAIGLQDVPAVYSQMVRSLVRGLAMSAPGVVDRGNVANTQADEPNRVWADSLMYFRLGYTGTFAEDTLGSPSLGVFGYRKEVDAFGIDVSFLNISHTSSWTGSSYDYYGRRERGVTSNTWLKLMFLKFTSPRSSRSPYVGGGLSWTTVELNANDSNWDGNGLQGEITAGYELGRASSIRSFLQADIGLPFYRIRGERYTGAGGPPYYTPPTYVSTGARYAPTLTLSLGVGWQRGRK